MQCHYLTVGTGIGMATCGYTGIPLIVTWDLTIRKNHLWQNYMLLMVVKKGLASYCVW